MKNLLFIINPYAGKMKIRPQLLDIIQMFNEAGYNTTVRVTLYRGHATEIVKATPSEIDMLVVSGGDGTLNEVITGLLLSGKKLPVGYIPAGSTNDFAASFGISNEPKDAAKSIINGTGFDIDIGLFNSNRYFSYIASFGVFTAASYKTPQNVKNTFGHLAYVLEGIKDITKITTYNVKAETDDKTLEGSYIFGSVTNTTSVGGIVKLREDIVKMNDGLFEIVLVKKPNNLNDLNKIIGGCLTSNFEDDVFEFIKTKNIKFTFEGKVDWSLDGEHEKTGKEVEICNLPTQVTIIR